jgi:hypothetical protein
MTEQVPPQGLAEPQRPNGPEEQADTKRSTTTGVAAVDRVLADIDAVDDLPLEQHLGAFERAHESLRAALDPSDEPADGPTDEPTDQPTDQPTTQPGDPA